MCPGGQRETESVVLSQRGQKSRGVGTLALDTVWKELPPGSDVAQLVECSSCMLNLLGSVLSNA